MRVMTWNINGLRAAKVPLKNLFDSFCCEIICIQETKVSREYLDEQTAIVEGYNSYFSFSKVRSGYSGVAIFVKEESTPWLAEDGLSNIKKSSQDVDATLMIGCYGDLSEFTDEELTALDSEGRCVMTEHEIVDEKGQERRLVIINVYCPRADPDNEVRVSFKLRFYRLLQLRAEAIIKSGRHVIIVGDINTSHKAIDHCDPADEAEFKSNPGRQWMDSFLLDQNLGFDDNSLICREIESKKHFVDVFRLFHPSTPNLFTNWCSLTNARATNYGCRLDYIFADKKLALETKVFTDCRTCPEIMGSDHCPVIADLSCLAICAPKCPPLCTKYMPQFSGKQQKLSSFFFSKNVETSSDNERVIREKNVAGDSFFKPSKSTERVVSGKSAAPTKRSHKNNPTSSDVKIKKAKNGLFSYFIKSEKLNEAETSHHSDKKKLSHLSHENSDLIAEGPKQSELSRPQDHCLNGRASPKMQPSQDSDINRVSCNDKLTQQKQLWGGLLKGPPKAPLCRGHKEPCVLHTVKKLGPNKGRQFWVCNRPEGHKTNAEARCDYFVWVDKDGLLSR